MAEYRVPTQAEINRLLYMQGLQGKTKQQIIDENLVRGIAPIPENIFQRIAGGARAAGEFVNRAGSAADVAKLFPGYKPETKVTIPTGYSFAPKQAPTGEIIPGGLQTQNVNLGQVLGAIKPADVLGISGAERAYTDIGLGKAPQPLDVLDVAGLGATGLIGGKAALQATRGLPVGMSIQEAKGLLQTAPKSDIGFYSAVEQAAMASPRKSGAGQAFLNDIMKGQDVRADEIKWMGLDEFLKSKQNITKQEVQDYIANNRVNVQEIALRENAFVDDGGSGYRILVNGETIDNGSFNTLDEAQNALNSLERDLGWDGLTIESIDGGKLFNETKFGEYTLPGGKNYRELLLTMPAKQLSEAEARVVLGASPDAKLSPADIAYASRKNVDEYKSPHFPQPNILAHLRVNDRVDADGKKMLLIEEVQSDWHQAGREKGYKNIEQQKAFEAALEEAKQYSNELKEKYGGANVVSTMATVEEQNKYSDLFAKAQKLKPKSEIPDAPFKDTWYQLALKRAIQHAAENGYDRIGLTTGSQQAARFDLSKQISELHYSGTNLVAYDKAGNQVIQKTGVAEADLPGLIGKEAAKKLMEQPKQGTLRSLVGQELQVGGEGMKKYYDEIYPKFLDKYGKKWGARVGETTVPTDRSNVGGVPSMYPNQEPIRYLDITPEMKAGVSKGQPLFQAAPIIGTGLLGQQEER